MPFYLYREVGQYLERVREVSLGGKNIIYKGWVALGNPLNRGWHMDSDKIISQTQQGGTYPSYRIIIDLMPKRKHIVLLELLDIYGFTFDSNGQPDWTPLMFRMRDAFNDPAAGMDRATKESLKQRFYPIDDNRDIFEFVYLQGNWNPGPVGVWNAALLHPQALGYFKRHL